jgi:hypothetical protein
LQIKRLRKLILIERTERYSFGLDIWPNDHKKALQSQLWNIANTQRGKMRADEFRDYIFGHLTAVLKRIEASTTGYTPSEDDFGGGGVRGSRSWLGSARKDQKLGQGQSSHRNILLDSAEIKLKLRHGQTVTF